MQRLGNVPTWVALRWPSTLLPFQPCCPTGHCLQHTCMHAAVSKATLTFWCQKCRMLRCNFSIPTDMLSGPFRVQALHSILHARRASGGLAYITQPSLHWQFRTSTQCRAMTQPSKVTWQAWTPPGSKVCSRQPQEQSPACCHYTQIWFSWCWPAEK